ncbi:hypothetical protein BpHYR1_011057 [Brachionus plicatilis]|uniref:Uncharacterized protein n=1 Tax=Brachionus plicatilis TaxID=10195 RepID=A0A3M7PNT8_BRAPC|nr:hypothetical protein BpHYR1_011057 [Brachionus plicatilis]
MQRIETSRLNIVNLVKSVTINENNKNLTYVFIKSCSSINGSYFPLCKIFTILDVFQGYPETRGSKKTTVRRKFCIVLTEQQVLNKLRTESYSNYKEIKKSDKASFNDKAPNANLVSSFDIMAEKTSLLFCTALKTSSYKRIVSSEDTNEIILTRKKKNAQRTPLFVSVSFFTPPNSQSICHIIIVYDDSIKNKIILPHLSSFSYNGPNYHDPFNGPKRNRQEIKRSKTNFILIKALTLNYLKRKVRNSTSHLAPIESIFRSVFISVLFFPVLKQHVISAQYGRHVVVIWYAITSQFVYKKYCVTHQSLSDWNSGWTSARSMRLSKFSRLIFTFSCEPIFTSSGKSIDSDLENLTFEFFSSIFFISPKLSIILYRSVSALKSMPEIHHRQEPAWRKTVCEQKWGINWHQSVRNADLIDYCSLNNVGRQNTTSRITYTNYVFTTPTQ